MVRQWRWLTFLVAGALWLLAGCARPAPPAKLYVHDRPVQYRLADREIRELIPPDWQSMDVNDAVTAGDQGKARLLFGDSLAVEVYRNTVLQTKGTVVTAGDQTTGLRLDDGTINVTERLAQQRVRVETDWAIIKSLGTIFFVHYDRRRGWTWVVVKQGRVSVTAGGVEIIVSAGEQTWVEPGGRPVGPLPACRNVVGDRFPRIEALTNDYIPDIELLCQQGPTPTPTPTPRPTVPPPTPVRPATLTPTRLRPTVTLSPTRPRPTVTPSPTRTATASPTRTPTPRLRCDALALLAPPDAAIFRGPNAIIKLSWTSVGELAQDEYYVVTSEFPSGRETTRRDVQSTKNTSLQVPRYIYDSLSGSRRVVWRVSVRRQTWSDYDQSLTSDVQICPDTRPRSYTWALPTTGTASAASQYAASTTGWALVSGLLSAGLALGVLLVRYSTADDEDSVETGG
jgi:hypothetical protein